ncbi:hypothetical protein [Effusibacillus dendaii]|uniref:Glycosyltransferase subfamily 4-like N-terminal domain-containing protein n=1 Tax=Effusibacillus dendaii TaxID=2743772 RepID=A0A7I8DE60_9BACL|nr:hypothetical protein [Effusibacillus dendaii]BCJ88317.1 hypothetical protein skT53_33020 [Effusibacillus dendaii]
MRILVATYWPLPHIGGVSTYVDTLRSGLGRLGHVVEILAQHPDLTGFYLLKARLYKKSKGQEDYLRYLVHNVTDVTSGGTLFSQGLFRSFRFGIWNWNRSQPGKAMPHGKPVFLTGLLGRWRTKKPIISWGGVPHMI